ncbi:MAG: S-layer homology domain-containing protein [Eubacteriales bacterium]|nr:S-layer homology domain-containing protein [Eubacteriales bacterium]
MNKWFRTVCAGALLAGALTASAFAADFTDCADHLKDLGLFQGTEQGYELDRAPTRAEAAAMLVRLLGKEDAAKALEYTAPFTDLQNWEKPYVQYLYENGLTTGAAPTAFEPEGRCTAQMYAAFLLRVLGYAEAEGDFTYREAVSFAEQTGLYDASTVDVENFLRDHVAAASYTALSLAPKGQSDTLLDSLIGQGAVDAEAAAPYRSLFDVYARYRGATAGMDELTALSLKHTLTVDNTGALGSFALTSAETTSIDRGAPALLTSRTVTLRAGTVGEKAFTAESYTADGYSYIKQDGAKSRRALSARQMRLAFTGYARVPVALIEEMTASSAQVYAFRYSEAGLSRLNGLLDAARAAVGGFDEMEVSGLRMEQRVSGGRIASQELEMEYSADDLHGSVVSSAQLLAVNEHVAVTAPSNLDQYPLVQ